MCGVPGVRFDAGDEALREGVVADRDGASHEPGQVGGVVLRFARGGGGGELLERRGGAVGVRKSGMDHGRRCQADHQDVCVPDGVGARFEPLEPSGTPRCGTAKRVDASLRAAYVHEVARRLHLEARREPVCDPERLVDAAGIDQRIDPAQRHQVENLVEPAGGRERDPGVELVEGRLRPFVDPQLDAEVVVEDPHLASQSGVRGEPDRLAHIVEAAGISDSAAGEAEVAERARRPLQAELVGERDRSLSRGECGVTPTVQEVRTRDLGQRLDVHGPPGQRFQQCQGLGRQLDPARIGQAGEQACEHVHGVRQAGEIAALLERRDRLLQCLLRLESATGVECGLGEAHERLWPAGVCGWGQRQRSLQVGERRGGVEARARSPASVRNRRAGVSSSAALSASPAARARSRAVE